MHSDFANKQNVSLLLSRSLDLPVKLWVCLSTCPGSRNSGHGPDVRIRGRRPHSRCLSDWCNGHWRRRIVSFADLLCGQALCGVWLNSSRPNSESRVLGHFSEASCCGAFAGLPSSRSVETASRGFWAQSAVYDLLYILYTTLYTISCSAAPTRLECLRAGCKATPRSKGRPKP